MSQLGDNLRERPSQHERFTRLVQFLIAVRTGDLAAVVHHLQADASLVNASLVREDWGRAEMGQPTLPMEFDYTPLHFAVAYGQPELAELLLAHGATIDDATPGETPLSRAAVMHDVPTMELFLRHGANPNHISKAGLTPLHRAAMRGHTAVVRSLLSHRADAELRDRSGRTPRDWAILGGWSELVDILHNNGAAAQVGQAPSRQSTGLLGRIVDPSGNPLDGLGPIPDILPRTTTRDGLAVSGPLLETGIKHAASRAGTNELLCTVGSPRWSKTERSRWRSPIRSMPSRSARTCATSRRDRKGGAVAPVYEDIQVV